MLRIALLGPLRAWLDDVPLKPPRRSDTSRLWVYLLLHRGSRLAREAVASDLWPEAKDARFVLRFNLHHLGQFLPPDPPGRPWLLVERDHVAWNDAADAEVDLDAFTAEIARARDGATDRPALEAALSRHAGRLLEGFDDPWLQPARNEVNAAFCGAMESLAAACGEAGDWTAALSTAERLMAHDPLREESYRLAMRLHLASGDRVGAIGIFDRCRAVVAAELDVPLDPETLALAEIARRGTAANGREAGGAPDAVRVLDTDNAGAPDSARASDAVRVWDAACASVAGAANWPRHATPYIGPWRIDETVARLDTSRVLTLVGAPGTGKSRLAAAAAERWMAGGPPGARIERIDLADWAPDIDIPVAVAVARSFGLVAEDAAACATALSESLGDCQAWLVLDNADRAASSCARLVEALAAASPGLRIVATSRRPLGTRIETVWRVPPLAVPDSRSTLDPADPPEAVALFLSRASHHLRVTMLTRDQGAAVARLCRAADGVAEIVVRAAARAAEVSLDELATALEAGDMGVLDGASTDAGSPDADGPRFARWRDAVAASVDALPGSEAVLFRRLAVFEGGFDCAAVEAVCAGVATGGDVDAGHVTAVDGISPDDVVDLLDRLVAQALVQVDVNAPAIERNRLLRPVRWAAALGLRESGEEEVLRVRLGDCRAVDRGRSAGSVTNV